MNLFAILAGSVVGLVVGLTAGWLLPDFGWIPRTLMWKCIAGGLLGGLAGGVAGSITGDLNRQGDSGIGGKFMLAFIFGAIFGVLGGSRFELIGDLLSRARIPHPF